MLAPDDLTKVLLNKRTTAEILWGKLIRSINNWSISFHTDPDNAFFELEARIRPSPHYLVYFPRGIDQTNLCFPALDVERLHITPRPVAETPINLLALLQAPVKI